MPKLALFHMELAKNMIYNDSLEFNKKSYFLYVKLHYFQILSQFMVQILGKSYAISHLNELNIWSRIISLILESGRSICIWKLSFIQLSYD